MVEDIGMNVIVHDSPVGPLTLVSNGARLVGLHFAGWSPPAHAVRNADSVLTAACSQLDAYFSHRLTAFAVPLGLNGTPFQLRVWTALSEIPFGQTLSYGQLARAVGRPSASRAVGAANGRNPIAIIVPCHRVVGADGSLTGFGGGIERKRLLLNLERSSELRLTG